jgi:hypothetical protein
MYLHLLFEHVPHRCLASDEVLSPGSAACSYRASCFDSYVLRVLGAVRRVTTLSTRALQTLLSVMCYWQRNMTCAARFAC